MSTSAVVDPHDKMRARDVNKVARGEQAPRPPQQSPPVSRPPPPSSTNPKIENKNDASQSESKKDLASSQMRRCYDSYHDYHKCVQEKGSEAEECKKVADYYKSMCPEWVINHHIKADHLDAENNPNCASSLPIWPLSINAGFGHIDQWSIKGN